MKGLAAGLLLLVAATGAVAADCSGYAADLQRMLSIDQAMRERVDPATVVGASKAPPAVERVQLVDRVNIARLQDWIDRCGWPRRSAMGEASVGAAWLLAQHADQAPAFQARVLELVRTAVAAGEESPSDLAYLSDRLAVAAGRPQEYGMQDMVDGECQFRILPVDDPVKVDERRRALKWPPLEAYKRLVLEVTFKGRCGQAGMP